MFTLLLSELCTLMIIPGKEFWVRLRLNSEFSVAALVNGMMLQRRMSPSFSSRDVTTNSAVIILMDSFSVVT